MTHEEIEGYRQELTNILKFKGLDKKDKLKALAIRVGTSTYHWGRVGGEDEATESQLVFNIQTALQTASMIYACRTSAENYKIAIKASKIAIWSVIAAWAAIVVGVLIAIFK